MRNFIITFIFLLFDVVVIVVAFWHIVKNKCDQYRGDLYDDINKAQNHINELHDKIDELQDEIGAMQSIIVSHHETLTELMEFLETDALIQYIDSEKPEQGQEM